jgi:predicted kinase
VSALGYGATVTVPHDDSRTCRDARTDPIALLVCGAPGSGKTTVGRALARRLGAALLDQDVVTGPLTAVVAGVLGVDDLDDPVLAGATRDARYETLFAAAEDNLRTGRPVVLVAPFTREQRQPDAWRRVTERLHGGRVHLVWLTLPPDELLRRMRERGAERDRPKLDDAAAFLARLDQLPPAVPHIAVDATADIADQCAKILAALH